MHNPYCMRCAATHAATPAIAFAQFRFSWGELCYTYSVSYTHLTLPTKLEV